MTNPNSLSRRGFLKSATALAAGRFAAPYIVPSGVLAAAGRPGANDRVGVAYIGVGRRANQLMDLPPDAQMVAVADVNLPRSESVAAKHRCRSYQYYEKMLEAKDVDAVVVATPDHWHTLPSIHACQAGKDVYCEKPLTLTIREGRVLVEAARKYQRVFQTGSQQRSMAANRQACELIRNNRIGKLHTVIGFNYPSPWLCNLPGQPVPAGLDWDMWCGPTELRPYHKDIYTPRAKPGWISFRQYSGGEMTGWGAHGLDQVQWALGMDESGPVEVWTDGGPLDAPIYTKPESRAAGEKACSQPKVFFRYANGVVLKLENGPHGGAIFIGDEGRISIDRGKFRAEPSSLATKSLNSEAVRLEVSDNHMQNWIDCIKSRKRPIADVEIGHRSATVCHLGNIARLLGRILRWDPERETFPGDAQANALIDVERRKPYELPKTV
uniref:GFO/IDH/MocA family secreted oxidoreductase n=1 Tax=uncultured planctomycete 3FN TaxID=455066 RepID=A9LGV8_9BACT|nr:GFO/IDH/MocA family secreted oxidoreductase [uncultured planctomycete 3FN]